MEVLNNYFVGLEEIKKWKKEDKKKLKRLQVQLMAADMIDSKYGEGDTLCKKAGWKGKQQWKFFWVKKNLKNGRSRTRRS